MTRSESDAGPDTSPRRQVDPAAASQRTADPADSTDPADSPTPQRRDHHTTYFLLYSQPQVVRELLELLDDEWVVSDLVDFSRLRRLPGQFVTMGVTRRRLDIAWMAPYGDDHNHLACVMEFQSTRDPKMPARINEYGHETTDSLIREGHLERFGTVPHGLGVVIYNGKDEWDIKGSAGVDGPAPGPNGLPSRSQMWVPFVRIDIRRYAAANADRNTLLVWLGLAEDAKLPTALYDLLKKANKGYPGPENAELRRAVRVWTREKWKEWGPLPENLDRLTMMEEADLMNGSVAREKERLRARAAAATRASTMAENVAKVVRRRVGADEARLSALLDVTNGAAGSGALMDAALDAKTFDDFEAQVQRLIARSHGA